LPRTPILAKTRGINFYCLALCLNLGVHFS
jgi:hypothetical protein